MRELPIEKIREAFLTSKASVKVVRADTGSGKTTRIPLWLIENGLPFILIEPRRVVVKSIFDYVSQFTLAQSLGYQVRFEKNISSHCLGLIVTPGIFLNYLSSSMPLIPKLILIDEFHERHKEVDFLLAILKRRKELDLVLLSATLDLDRLNQYLDFECFDVNQGSFPVQVEYENLDVIPNSRNLGLRVQNGLKKFNWTVALVFLPGKREIFEVKNFLRTQGYTNVHAIYGNQSPKEQLEALKSGESRVLLSTNLLESAMTVEGVDLVIDTGLCRALRYHYGQEVLTLEPIAEDAADQRKGRTGRTSPGVCFRLWSRSAKLETRTQPEILRSELTDICLRGRQIGLDASSLQYLDSPEPYQWVQAENQLAYLGYNGGRLKAANQLPLGARFLAIIECCREIFPEGLEYLLFFISFIESGSNGPPLVTAGVDDEGVPPDWLLWKIREENLQTLMGIEYAGFKKTFDHLCDYFGAEKMGKKFMFEHRGCLLQALASEFPESLYYHSKKKIWRNDFSRECTLPELVKGSCFSAIFVLDLFEVEDSHKRRVILAEAFFCYERKRGYKYPATRSEKGDIQLSENRAQTTIKHYFGSDLVGEEVRILTGEEFISDFCVLANLEKAFPGLEELAFYLRIFEMENSRPIQTEEYIRSRLRTLGARSYEDLELIMIDDFFDQEFRSELERLRKEYPMFLEEPGGKYALIYDPIRKEVIFHQARGSKEPSSLLRKRFRNWKLFWESKGRCVGL